MDSVIQKLKSKPASVFSVQTHATYDVITSALQNPALITMLKNSGGDTPAESLFQNIIQTLESNNEVVFILYRKYEDSVLLLHGNPVQSFKMQGTTLEKKLQPHAKDEHIYAFSYV